MTNLFAEGASARLGRVLAPELAAHPGRTGIHVLADPHGAFAARILLAGTAETSIDVQYFLWHDDQTGRLLLKALAEAAARGVRVRLLLDDFYTSGLDSSLAALDALPNFEVRLYNPFTLRRARALELLWNFARFNRRMHNKSFTVDGQISIVGGRNVGNEYFAVGSGVAFADLDLIAVGAAIPDIQTEFDRYWSSSSAVPVGRRVSAPREAEHKALQAQFDATLRDRVAVEFLNAVRQSSMISRLLDGTLRFVWAPAKVVADDPGKTSGGPRDEQVMLFPELVRTMGPVRSSLDLISPYFVPADYGTAQLTEMARRGIAVRILTNSLASTNISAVHAGYAKRRRRMLEAGVKIYELKPQAGSDAKAHGKPWFKSASASALHAKTFAVDGRRLFVGSFNFDPRSAMLNTEMGLVIESPVLAGQLSDAFDVAIPAVAYAVELHADGSRLRWTEHGTSAPSAYDHEPLAGLWTRLGVRMLGWLPFDGLL